MVNAEESERKETRAVVQNYGVVWLVIVAAVVYS